MTNDIRIQFALLSTALLFLVAGALFQQQLRETPTVLDELDLTVSQGRAAAPVLTAESPQPAPQEQELELEPPPATPQAPLPTPPPAVPAETTFQ
jgi:hypothetical protein